MIGPDENNRGLSPIVTTESIALTVSVLTKGANTFYGQGGL